MYQTTMRFTCNTSLSANKPRCILGLISDTMRYTSTSWIEDKGVAETDLRLVCNVGWNVQMYKPAQDWEKGIYKHTTIYIVLVADRKGAMVWMSKSLKRMDCWGCNGNYSGLWELGLWQDEG